MTLQRYDILGDDGQVRFVPDQTGNWVQIQDILPELDRLEDYRNLLNEAVTKGYLKDKCTADGDNLEERVQQALQSKSIFPRVSIFYSGWIDTEGVKLTVDEHGHLLVDNYRATQLRLDLESAQTELARIDGELRSLQPRITPQHTTEPLVAVHQLSVDAGGGTWVDSVPGAPGSARTRWVFRPIAFIRGVVTTSADVPMSVRIEGVPSVVGSAAVGTDVTGEGDTYYVETDSRDPAGPYDDFYTARQEAIDLAHQTQEPARLLSLVDTFTPKLVVTDSCGFEHQPSAP